ncbi:MAG: DUF748 domain-containing protein [Gammaproteobacteria bacterium]|nr:DUF748 domain-containing protein [Gammaproteobacteria bacterium]
MNQRKDNQPSKPGFIRYLILGLSILIVAGLVLYGIGGFYLLPRLAKSHLEDYVAQHLDRRLSIDGIYLNPFSLFVEIDGVNLRERDGTPLVSLQRLSADVSLTDLLKRRILLDEITLQSPWVKLEVAPDGSSNLGRLVEDASSSSAGPEQKTQDSPPVPWHIGRVGIENAIVRIARRTQTSLAETYISPINIELTNLSMASGERGSLLLSANTENGGELTWEGDIGLQPLGSSGHLSLRGVKPILLWSFLREELNIDEPHGLIDLEANYRLTMGSEGLAFNAERIGLVINDLLVRREGAGDPLLTLDKVALAEGSFELANNHLQIGQLQVSDGTVRVVRAHTLFDWQQLMRQAVAASDSDDPKPESEQKTVPWQVSLEQLAVERIALTYEDRDRVKPFTVHVGALDLSLAADATQDASHPLQVKVGDIGVSVSGLSLSQAGEAEALLRIEAVALDQGEVDLAARTVDFGQVRLRGGKTRVIRSGAGMLNWTEAFAPSPSSDTQVAAPQASSDPWRVDIASTQLEDFSIAVTDHGSGEPVSLVFAPASLQLGGVSSLLDKPVDLKLSLVVNQQGKLAATGRLDPSGGTADLRLDLADLALTPVQPYLKQVAKVALESGKLFSNGRMIYGTNGAGSFSYAGGLRLDGLRVTEPGAGGVLAGWRSLEVASLALSTSPDNLKIEEILLFEPEGRFVINKDLTTNWQAIVAGQPASGATSSPPGGSAQVFPMTIGRIKVDRGKLDFSDFSLPLDFVTQIHDLSGVVAGISSDPGARTSSSLKGRVDEFGAAEISGELNPFDPLLFTDMTVSFANLEMGSLTPYTVKFAGHAIDSGKLSLDLKYRIAKRQLQGDNQILIDSLVLGKKVESPDAIDAPLELAIALLQDTDGRIDLGLPVSGDMNDPQFSYGHLVWKALGNLLAKIVTAPFRALGAALGVKGEDLDTVAFQAGQQELSPPEQEKLRSVAQILAKRPRLNLEIQGSYDSKRDGDALKSRLVNLELAKAMGRKVKPEEDPDPLSLADQATRQAIERLFTVHYSAAELKRLKTPSKNQTKGAGNTAGSMDGLYQELYDRLVSRQSLKKGVLGELAIKRAQAIGAELTGAGKLAAARIQIGKPMAAEGGGGKQVLTRLNLKASE